MSLPQKTDAIFADLIIKIADSDYSHLQNKVLAHLLEHYLIGRILPNIKEETKISGVVRYEYIRISIKTRAKIFMEEYKTILDTINNEIFTDQKTFQYEKDSIINEAVSALNRPDSLVYNLVAKKIFTNSKCRYAIQLSDELENSKKVSLGDLKKYYNSVKTSDRFSLFVGSHTLPHSFEKEIKKLINGLQLTYAGRKINGKFADTKECALTPAKFQNFVYKMSPITGAEHASYVALVYQGYPLPLKTSATKHIAIALLCRSIVGQYSNKISAELRQEGVYANNFLRKTFPELGLIVFWSHIPLDKITRYITATKNATLKPTSELLTIKSINDIKKRAVSETKTEWQNNLTKYEFIMNIILEEETGYSDINSLLLLIKKINPQIIQSVHKDVFYNQKPKIIVISNKKLPANTTKKINLLSKNWFNNV